jgi:hypothetical protein
LAWFARQLVPEIHIEIMQLSSSYQSTVLISVGAAKLSLTA